MFVKFEEGQSDLEKECAAPAAAGGEIFSCCCGRVVGADVGVSRRCGGVGACGLVAVYCAGDVEAEDYVPDAVECLCRKTVGEDGEEPLEC